MTDDKQKTLGQAKNQLFGIMKPLRLYGQQDYCDIAVALISEVMEVVYRRAQGEDVPIIIDDSRIKW